MDEFPILKSIAQLADLQPVVIVDSREQLPLPVARWKVRVGTLRTGDYSFAGGEERFAVERKSIADLVGCCAGDNRDRFERELHRMRGYHFARLLIVGRKEDLAAGTYRSKMSPTSVLSSLNAWEARYNVPVVFSNTPEEAAKLVESWIWWNARELVESVNELWRGANEPKERKPAPEASVGAKAVGY